MRYERAASCERCGRGRLHEACGSWARLYAWLCRSVSWDAYGVGKAAVAGARCLGGESDSELPYVRVGAGRVPVSARDRSHCKCRVQARHWLVTWALSYTQAVPVSGRHRQRLTPASVLSQPLKGPTLNPTVASLFTPLCTEQLFPSQHSCLSLLVPSQQADAMQT